MRDHDNDLRRLTAADPIGPDTLPSAQDPEARELFERITMVNRATLTRRPLLLAAALLAVLAASGAAIATRDNNQPATRQATATTTTQPAITPGGSIGSCVEMYNLDTLKRREAAFDGTVQAVDGDKITFNVTRWYRGGNGTTTTRNGASTLGSISSAGPSVALEPGTRLLVSGDGGFAWGCGFTQPYDATVAAEWAQTLSS